MSRSTVPAEVPSPPRRGPPIAEAESHACVLRSEAPRDFGTANNRGTSPRREGAAGSWPSLLEPPGAVPAIRLPDAGASA